MDKLQLELLWKRLIILYLFFPFILVPFNKLACSGELVKPAFSPRLNACYTSLNFSTFLGGSGRDFGKGIAIADDGSCYVTGYSSSGNFPTLNAYNSTFGDGDAFVTKFSTNGSLLWSTYLGGSGWDEGRGIAVANDSSCYVIGETWSSNFPTKNAFDSTYNGNSTIKTEDAFVVKFSTNGSLLWNTYLGGSDYDYGRGITIADDGSCYVTGSTASRDFPTLNAYDNSYNEGDAFVTKFSTNGSLLWSTYLGGSHGDGGHGIAVADNGNCYVTGGTVSSDFPTLNAYDNSSNGLHDVFITKFSSSGSLLWSTYLGGSDYEYESSIAVAADGSCYVTGITDSSNFPTLNAYDSSYNSGDDAFVAKISVSGSLILSTFIGGKSWERGFGIDVDNLGSFYLIGETGSEDFPTMNAFDRSFNGRNPFVNGGDIFITKFLNDGSLLWSTFLGGRFNDIGYDIAVTIDGYCYLTGGTESGNFPIINAYNSTNGGEWDAIVVKFNPLAKQHNSSFYGFLAFIIVVPILVIVLRKKRK